MKKGTYRPNRDHTMEAAMLDADSLDLVKHEHEANQPHSRDLKGLAGSLYLIVAYFLLFKYPTILING